MDPVAHTLVGATLAELGLKKYSRYATATLIIGANLPDIDGIANIWGRDAALLFRRGWSHGILATLLLPLLLTGTIFLWHRWRGKRQADAPPLHLGVILALSYLATLSHPFLDWLNTYGVRLLMPFDERWFYGDTLFIVDPWMWLLAAAGVVMARSSSRGAITGWLLLAALTSWLIVTTDLAPTAVKVGWCMGVAAIALLRWWGKRPRLDLVVARTSFGILVVYVCTAYGLARVAETALVAANPGAQQAQANPSPGNPTAHRIVLEFPSFYRVIKADGRKIDVPRQQPDAIVQAALADDSVRGFVNWMRFPYWEVEETDTSWVVTIGDLRYTNPGEAPAGIGTTTVEVAK